MAGGLLAPIKARFGELVAGMRPRDRQLLAGLIIFVFAGGLVGLWWVADASLGGIESRLASRRQTLGTLKELVAQQANAADKQAKIEEQLRNNAGSDLASIVERTAGKVGIGDNLKGVKERATSVDGDLEEKTYGVELDRVSLQQLVEFLHEVETGGYPLQVRTMKVNTVTSAGVKVLKVTMEMSMFRLLDAPAPAP
jgi:type II secretory pathway component PulM